MQDEHASKLASVTTRATAEAAKAKKAEERAADLEKQITDLEKQLADLEKQLADYEKQLADSEKQTTGSDDKIKKAQTELKEKEQERAAAQTELDDLLMVFGDVEEKAKKYKVGSEMACGPWIRSPFALDAFTLLFYPRIY